MQYDANQSVSNAGGAVALPTDQSSNGLCDGGHAIDLPAQLPPRTVARERRQQVRSSLRASTKDGIAWAFMHGAGERYVAPFVILSGSGLLSLATMTALPALAGALVQLAAAAVTDRVGRRRTIYIKAALLQAVLWLPLTLAIFMPTGIGYWVMLTAYVLAVAGHHFSQPAWFSTMGDIVPPTHRGRYFGQRNLLSGIVMIGGFLAAGAWLTWCENNVSTILFGVGGRNYGFVWLFLLAGLARAISTCYLTQMVEPAYTPPTPARRSVGRIVSDLVRTDFGRYLLHRAVFTAAHVLLITYLGWYLLGELEYSAVLFATIMTANMIAIFGAQPFWGRFADRIGNRRILVIGTIAALATPLLLTVSNNPWWLGAVLFYDGVVFSAFAMAVLNYLFEIVPSSERARASAQAAVFTTVLMTVMCYIAATLALWGGAESGAYWLGVPPFMLILGVIFALLLVACGLLPLLPNLGRARRARAV